MKVGILAVQSANSKNEIRLASLVPASRILRTSKQSEPKRYCETVILLRDAAQMQTYVVTTQVKEETPQSKRSRPSKQIQMRPTKKRETALYSRTKQYRHCHATENHGAESERHGREHRAHFELVAARLKHAFRILQNLETGKQETWKQAECKMRISFFYFYFHGFLDFCFVHIVGW